MRTEPDGELVRQAHLLMQELAVHGVRVSFEYALEAVTWELVEESWASVPAAGSGSGPTVSASVTERDGSRA